MKMTGLRDRLRTRAGLTLVELMVVVAIIATLAVLAIPLYTKYLQRTRLVRAIRDIRTIEEDLSIYSLREGGLPSTLAGIGRDETKDPWGAPYIYLPYSRETTTALFRKERFLVPLNVEYDLYSRGPDGQSEPELSAPASLDDVVRANDGAFVGLASEF